VTSFKKATAPQLHIAFGWDMSVETENRLDIVFNNTLIGLSLVIIILFIFMNFTNAFWTAAGIPFSIAFALIFFNIYGITINSVSLLGIIVVLGMIVDDSIVVSENIFRHEIAGESKDEAARHGVAEVRQPVIATILTTIVAFLPLFFMKGIIGSFSKEIPVVVIFVLAGSLLECLLVLPTHLRHFSFTFSKQGFTEKKFVIKLRNAYKALLNRILQHYKLVLGAAVILCISGIFLWIKVIGYENFPTQTTTHAELWGKVTDGSSLQNTLQKIKPLEKILAAYNTNALLSYRTEIGNGGFPEKFYLSIRFCPPEERDLKADTVITALKKKIHKATCFTNVHFNKHSGGPREGRDITVDIIGNDNHKRRQLADKIYAFFTSNKAIGNVERSDRQSKTEIKVNINYSKAASLGISTATIARTIRSAYEGVIATTLQEPREVISFRVMLDEKYKHSLQNIYKLKVRNRQNRLIPLKDIVTLSETQTFNRIEHQDGDRTTTIYADMADGTDMTPAAFYQLLDRRYADFTSAHPGFNLKIGGEAQSSREAMN
ncbi:MAG TPA: efflux RND transporter permease subunit, partial [Spirochaetota bacterium]|nr:efflux RND transporter permease subunit [Spirochaetota bacterium]